MFGSLAPTFIIVIINSRREISGLYSSYYLCQHRQILGNSYIIAVLFPDFSFKMKYDFWLFILNLLSCWYVYMVIT